MSDLTPSLPAPPPEYLPAEVYVVRPPNPRYWLHILLFVATIFTTLVVGAKMEFDFLQQCAAVCSWRRNSAAVSRGLGASRTVSPAARNSLFGHAAADSSGARDGALSVLPLLRRVRHASLFHSSADSDWNAGSGHSHTLSYSLPLRAVRHWDRGAHRRICSRARPCW